MTEGLMQDNCQFGDMLKDEKRKSQFKYELGRLMSEYAVPLPLGNFSLNNKETRRLELLKNCRGIWFDHVEHMEEGPEQNKEWENFWWTVDEDMITYVMKTKIEESIDEKLIQEFQRNLRSERIKTMIVKKKSPQRQKKQMMMNQKQIMQMLITIWTLQI